VSVTSFHDSSCFQGMLVLARDGDIVMFCSSIHFHFQKKRRYFQLIIGFLVGSQQFRHLDIIVSDTY
jgi:hypothetical protein